eukprot:5841315-Pyramimonas_sp.AAC.1
MRYMRRTQTARAPHYPSRFHSWDAGDCCNADVPLYDCLDPLSPLFGALAPLPPSPTHDAPSPRVTHAQAVHPSSCSVSIRAQDCKAVYL